MTEPVPSPATAGVIYSRLYKASYLTGNSAVFPLLVKAACAHHQAHYSQEALEYVGTRREILDALEMTENTALDDVLRGFAMDPETADAMDQLILTATHQYKQEKETD